MRALADVTSLSIYSLNLVTGLGLGLAIDYSLLMVHRFREEADVAASVDDAVVATARTAGRTVALSAIAVAVGLSALIVVPVPFVRSLGSAGLVVNATWNAAFPAAFLNVVWLAITLYALAKTARAVA